ncbi:centromere protein Cenp-K [Phycomyces nitens]|nr:centromere protein Cenp-K [Phycomyces nitens]
MWLSSQLQSLIARAANDFDETVATDRVVESEDDGTTRGMLLDSILASQKVQRESLWKRLHQLEDQYEQAGLQRVYGSVEDSDEKLLSVYMYEERELIKEEDIQRRAAFQIEYPPEEDVLNLQLKEQLEKTVSQLKIAVDHVKAELKSTKASLASENTILEECKAIKIGFAKKLVEAQESGASQRLPSKFTEKSRKLRTEIRYMSSELIKFADTYFPSHAVDGEEGNEDPAQCELKYIIEDLMNKGSNPANLDPFIELQPGEYWTPYIETLVKAGIAMYHPQDASKICLADFRL